MNTTKRFKAVVVGLGLIGGGDDVSAKATGQNVSDQEGTHAQALAAHPLVDLVAGADLSGATRQRFQARLGVERTYADWREMLVVEKPDIVSVAVNSPYHAEITTACAEAGVSAVICEKPLASCLADADRAIEACRKHGTTLIVNHHRRWNPLWIAVRDEIRSGSIGTVSHADVHWCTGRLGNVGSHWFDALSLLLDAKPISVSATLDPEPYKDPRGADYCDPGGWGIIAFDNGVRAFINAPYQPKIPLRVRIVGTLGQVTFRGVEAEIEFWDGSKRILKDAPNRAPALFLAVDDLVESLISGQSPASTGAEAISALEVIIGFHASDLRGGQWLSLPVQGVDRDIQIKIG